MQIKNLYTFKDATFNFGDYNVVFGRNASGKTNLLRILKLLIKPPSSDSPPSFLYTRISNDLRFNKDLRSSIKIEIGFSKEEVKRKF